MSLYAEGWNVSVSVSDSGQEGEGGAEAPLLSVLTSDFIQESSDQEWEQEGKVLQLEY